MAPTELLRDLADEIRALDRLLHQRTGGPDGLWLDLPTRCAGWTIADQLRHLTLSDRAGVLAATEPDRFIAESRALLRGVTSVPADAESSNVAVVEHDAVARWHLGAAELIQALTDLPDGVRLPWFGPSMTVRSFATARLMETWAHGTDIALALGLPYPATDRLAHICHLGVATYGWSFTVRGLDPPTTPIAVSLTLPSGAQWTNIVAGADIVNHVEGLALDFCDVVTQRRHIDATQLVVTGPDAIDWMHIAQAFAGRPTTVAP